MLQTVKPKLHPDWINPHALKVVKKLQSKGFLCYLVGGCVRDLMVGINPKDFDIVSSARPRQIKKSIPNAYIIGKRFRLVLARRGDLQLEIATFRRNKTAEDLLDISENEPEITGDNYFGEPEEDAQRRDFTINALFYDPFKNEVIDFLTGKEDLKYKNIKIIGEAKTRILEDPIRIFRAIRLAHKLSFTIDPDLQKVIHTNSDCILESILPRRREEFIKFLKLKNPSAAFLQAKDLGILKHIAPTLDKALDNEEFVLRLREKPESLNHQSTAQLFSFLIWAYYRSEINSDPYKAHSGKELLANEDLMQLMKIELGMFNYEQAMACKAFSMQANFENFTQLNKKEKDVQSAKNAFPVAYLYSLMDQSHSASTLTTINQYIDYEK